MLKFLWRKNSAYKYGLKCSRATNKEPRSRQSEADKIILTKNQGFDSNNGQLMLKYFEKN